jgi:ribosomal protein S4
MSFYNKLKQKTLCKFNLYSFKLRFRLLNKNKVINSNIKKKSSEFGALLHAKQSLRFFYGNLRERQFYNYYKKVLNNFSFSSTSFLYQFLFILERRLDIVLFRARFVTNINQARLFILHNHVKINSKIINKVGYLVKVGDIIEVNAKLKKTIYSFLSSSISLMFSFLSNSFSSIENKNNLNFFYKYYLCSSYERRQLSSFFLSALFLRKKVETYNNEKKLFFILKTDKLFLFPNWLEINYKLLKIVYIKNLKNQDIVYPFKFNMYDLLHFYNI